MSSNPFAIGKDFSIVFKARKKNKPGPDIFKRPVTTSITKYHTSQCPVRKRAYSRYINRKKLIDRASTGGR